MSKMIAEETDYVPYTQRKFNKLDLDKYANLMIAFILFVKLLDQQDQIIAKTIKNLNYVT